MSDTVDVEVPEAMLKYCMSNGFYPGRFKSPGDEDAVRRILQCAVEWISKYPIVPTVTDLSNIAKQPRFTGEPAVQTYCIEWQRQMFRVRVPDEIKDLVYPEHDNSRLIEAYRRGQKRGLRA